MAQPPPIRDLDLIFTATQDLWREIRGQRVFITGRDRFLWVLVSGALCLHKSD